MGKVIGYIRENVWAQLVVLFGAIIVAMGVVNEATSFFTAPWLPSWGPAVIGVLLSYAGFHLIAFKLHQTVEAMKDVVAKIPPPPVGISLASLAAEPSKPRQPAEARGKNHWKPDISLDRAVSYVLTESTWRASYNSTNATKDAVEAVRKALWEKQITAWARQHPDTEEYQIDSEAWSHGVQIRPQDSYAFSDKFGAALYSIRLARDEVKAAWPKKG